MTGENPTEATDQAPAKPAQYEPEPQATAKPAAGEDSYLAGALGPAGQYRREAERRVAALEPPRQVPEPPPKAASASMLVAFREAGRVRSSEERVAEVRPDAAAPRPLRRPSARPRRPGLNRPGAGRGRRSRCPFLGWLQSVLAPPPTAAVRGAPRRCHLTSRTSTGKRRAARPAAV
jgi:hypothetical protein